MADQYESGWKLCFILIWLGVGLCGCSSIRDSNSYAAGWLNSPIEKYLLVVDREHIRTPQYVPSRQELESTRYINENGNTVYVAPENFNRCKIHWEVNQAGIIAGYTFENVTKNGCRW